VFLNIEDGKARWMHVGDSRLYHFVNGKLVHQTTDHSVSQMAVMMGEITTHQIRFHEDRNRVLRSLGGENAKADVSALLDVSSGNHAFLMCSDGFWEYVYEDEMEKTLQQASDPQAWIDSMEAILKQRIPSNNDNYTAGTVFVYSQPMAVGYAPKASSSPKSGKKAGLILFSGLAAVAVAAGVFLMKPLFSGEDEVPEQTIVLETETVVETTTVATTEETTEPEEQGDTQKSDGNSYDNNFDENNGDEASGDSETPSSAPSEPVPPDAIPSDSAPQDDLTPPVV
ncbi:MAG: hypothetical protein J6V25_08825, partial [Oscillospiraceae bacterium]|nr:hypothetical protein [Oscillospiraceae bacterium]